MKTYSQLNAMLNLYAEDGSMQLEKDHEAARAYFLEEVNVNTRFYHDQDEKIEFLTTNDFWDTETIEQYHRQFVTELFRHAYSKKFRFESFLGALKFYTSYAMKSDDGETILERYEDRVVMVALHLARGDEDVATNIVDEIMSGRFQPATPTFQNAGKARRGELVSCFLLDAQDSLDSIKDTWNYSAQLSKAGGGVAINMSDIREVGAPLKGKSGLAKGVVSWMKIYEDIFSTVDQLGTRQGAGAVYLSAHHPDIYHFLDTKRENADEKIRIKTLSTGVVITDVMMDLARRGEEVYTFSPHDVMKEYGIKLSQIDITANYDELVQNPRIKRTRINPRKLLSTLAELQMESGYPYILFSDTANQANPVPGTINMSNLCSEILQTNTPSQYDKDTGEMSETGRDISCNLGSMNVFYALQSEDIGKSIDTAMRALTAVSDMTDIKRVPTVRKANDQMHSVGLGQMSLATFFGTHDMYYGDEESLDFTNNYFMLINYHSLLSSMKLAVERDQVFHGFEDSTYADGSYFDQYLMGEQIEPQTKKVARIFKDYGVHLPTQADWEDLKQDVMKHGVFHAWRLAVPPTGSISYINNASASIHPVTSPLEIRKEGSVGRVYYPTPQLSESNMKYFEDAYDVGPFRLIDVYAEATKHVDQGLSCTLFFPENVSTRDINRAQIYAWKKGIKTLYYIRLKAIAIEGTDAEGCVSCTL